jgi:hypothetical protein
MVGEPLRNLRCFVGTAALRLCSGQALGWTAERSEALGTQHYFFVAFPSTAIVHFAPSGEVS